LKKADIQIEKVVVLIIVVIVLAIAIIFLMQDAGPLGWVKEISKFMNSTTEIVTNY